MSFNLNKGKISIFIDGNNLFHYAQQLNIEIDYTKLLKYITGNHSYSKAYFYGILDSNNDKQQGFYTWLKYNGYKVFTKTYTPQNHFNDTNDSDNNNSNKEQKQTYIKRQTLDVEIIVDMLNLLAKNVFFMEKCYLKMSF